VCAVVGYLVAGVLAVCVLLALPVEAEDDPRFLAWAFAGGTLLVIVCCLVGWRWSRRLDE
jgi:hypothetical protein